MRQVDLPQADDQSPKLRGWLSLSVIAICTALMWTLVLPRVGQIDFVRNRIDENKRRGIDPTALFYTDLEHLEYRDGLMRRIADSDRSPGLEP